MKHFITTLDWSREELQAFLDHAKALKADPIQPLLKDKSVALVFFNPSLRTRTSFDVGARQLGGHAVVLQPGRGAWPMEFEVGAKMDADAEEHVIEAARVLSRYCDIIAVRAFPKFENWEQDRRDHVIKAFAEYATVPVINMETITHPCQEMAHMLTLQEHLGQVDGKKFVLTWTYHPKPLNTAVANSGLIIASKFGMDVTLLCPTEDYLLDERYMNAASEYCSQNGHELTVTHDIEEAYDGADVVYAKSWGALPYFGRWDAEREIRDQYQHFIVDSEKMAMTNNALFSHCLPVRRNVKVTGEVLDSEQSVAIDEAENRLHVQKALMAGLIGD
ncbi:N-acetylornithine carbamoyltransferase [Persicimonas caeni]|uniref:N-acetylornithine carbamoyltransferase n=1 Tax=Persicimonas caeni TaxID=2292766 RepID=A0A4Y6PXW5_PERCE|nr:N-acetylornithine carbamoyltransferase [Persicimonas caeni]QDG52837.1 N-acetylornithine carbamoyltransferase [Persicimonas caeni]QED34059.1 N-acetylornithine carbamoyltransferase [Persicimonas caeni]